MSFDVMYGQNSGMVKNEVIHKKTFFILFFISFLFLCILNQLDWVEC